MTNPGEPLSEKPERSVRVWWFAGLLLLASAINYMDRQTLANAAVRIGDEFEMSQEQYGNLEAGFAWAFAAGSLFFGFLADKVSLRWLYAAVVLLWSAMGFLSGFVENYEQLLACRTLLGFFEAGHWPCGVKTIRALLDARGRTMGNGVLQSGTSIGAIATPLIMSALLTDDISSWRVPFQVIGAVGVLWVIAWVAWGPRDTLLAASSGDRGPSFPWWKILLERRMLLILMVVALINTTWQLLRAWLPKFLQEGRGYAENETLYFNSVWFAATDVGCLGAGALALWLARSGRSVLHARLLTFFACALMCLFTIAVARLPAGWLMLALLLVVGAGALGTFPIYHAFTQDISHQHQGKVTGIAGVAAWVFYAFVQPLFGRHIDETHSFDQGIALAGCLPFVAFLLLAIAWPRKKNTTED